MYRLPFRAEQRTVIQAYPTFEASEPYARSAGAEVISVPRLPHFPMILMAR